MKLVFSSWHDAWYFGPFVQWEPWLLEIGFNFGPYMARLEFEGAFTKEARKRRREAKMREKEGSGTDVRQY